MRQSGMSAQNLSPRSVRRIARSTGISDIVHGWAHGGYVFAFVTASHRHGYWDKRTGEWDWEDDPSAGHYSTCGERWPGYHESNEYEAALIAKEMR